MEVSHVSQRLDLFGVHGSSASGDITYLISHVNSQDHLIEVSCELMVESSLPILISFVTIDIVILKMSWSSVWNVTKLSSLVIIGIVVVFYLFI